MQSKIEFINVGNDTIGKPQFRTIEWIKESYRRKLKRFQKKEEKMKPGILSRIKEGTINWKDAANLAKSHSGMSDDTLRKIGKQCVLAALRRAVK